MQQRRHGRPTLVYDVVVAGGGNAALTAAIAARAAGPSVLVLEHAPKPMRRGDSRHTRNLRAMHTAPPSGASLKHGRPESG